MATLKHFLVATDYSESSRRAFSAAVELAEKLGASVEVLHVWPAPYFGPGYGYQEAAALDTGAYRSLFDRVRANAVSEMQAFVSSVSVPDSVKVKTHVESGDAPHQILEYIDRKKPDLVIVGTHGRTGPRRWLLGSVAERVVQHSPSPVLTVR